MHAVEPVRLVNEPAEQLVQADEPASEAKVPARQELQAVLAMNAEYMPVGHDEHDEDADAPTHDE